jgi:hypothetical protein
MPRPGSPIVVDGSFDFSGGVDSLKVTTLASQDVPNGLQRNQLAWLDNATVRDGGITQRHGWQPIGGMADGSKLYQGGFMYEPLDEFPYLIHAIGGVLYRQDMATAELTPLSSNPSLTMPDNIEYFYFAQADQFLVIQCNDGVTLPLFWDGTTLVRSRGITGVAVPGDPNCNQIPAAGPMDYYTGRIWYAQGRVVSAGDIYQGPSGTLAYNFRDAVLYVTENPLAIGGDGFVVAASDGNVRAIKHSGNIDAALGQGRLFIFTRKAVYSLNVPVTRTDWINADGNNQPLMTVVQLVNGSVNDRSVVAVNGDLFYQSLEPGIRSLLQAIRYFQQWGNIQISANETRILQFNDRSLLYAASGIFFDNRLLQTALPFQTPVGVAHRALIPMDFVPINSFNKQKEPNWEGMHEGLNFLQLFTGDFGGRERAFASVYSSTHGGIELWEITSSDERENGDNRVTWIIETPAWTWTRELDLKKLVSAEFGVDRLRGTVDFKLDYRPDNQTDWLPWHRWQVCSARNSCEDAINPICYPLTEYGPCYISTMVMPVPPEQCAQCNTGRPANVGYQFQLRLTVKGWCRVRSIVLHAEMVDRQLYLGIVC